MCAKGGLPPPLWIPPRQENFQFPRTPFDHWLRLWKPQGMASLDPAFWIHCNQCAYMDSVYIRMAKTLTSKELATEHENLD